MTAPDDAPAPAIDPSLAQAGLRRVRVVSLALANAAAALVVLLGAPSWLLGPAVYLEIRRGGVVTLPLAALLLALAGLVGTLVVARARVADARAAGRAARWPQALLVPALALPAGYLAWRLGGTGLAPMAPPETGFVLGGAAVLGAFPLLIAERGFAGMLPAVLAEAAGLRGLLLLATLTWFVAGLLEIAANTGVPYTGVLGTVVAVVLALTALELSARAVGRLFLPPPTADQARGVVGSLLARLVAGVTFEGGVGAPIRQHLGIDFSRSWALQYVRAAALPMLGFLALLAWGLSGIVLVPLDQRAVQERFGAPVAVLHPGLHIGLPWPLGTARRVEYGPVHSIGLSRVAQAIEMSGAEAPAPASVDRLWEQAHPAEIELLIASNANHRESFQSVSADLRILYRVGLSDGEAWRAAYATNSAEDLVRASAGRVIAGYFASRTLDMVLGADREAMAESLRDQLQAALDGAGSGLRAVAVVIEAIHPPAGAADAYHNVRAAEIAARASVAVERGAAATIKAQSRQYAFDQTSNATAAAAENVDGARTMLLRFTADQDAAHAGGRAFLLERYFAALTTALPKAPKTIIDHRLNGPEAPTLDLRPFAAAPSGGTGKEE